MYWIQNEPLPNDHRTWRQQTLYAQQLSRLWRAALLLGAGTMAVFALTACGGNDKDAPAAGTAPTQAPAPTAVLAPTATPAPAPPAAAVFTVTAPEPGSDEEQVLAVLERQVRAVNARDWVLFQKTCTPSAGKPPKVTLLKYVFEENGGRTDYAVHFEFSPEGYNVRNVEVKLLRGPMAQVSLELWDYDELVEGGVVAGGHHDGPITRFFEKVDGQWYSASAPCA